MEKISWNDKFLTGNLLIDDHHKKLFSLYDHIIHLKDDLLDIQMKILELIEEIIHYANYHFSAEREIAQFLHLELYKDHEDDHQRFISTIINFKKRLSLRYEVEIKNDLCFFIFNWIKFHILNEDMKIFKRND